MINILLRISLCHGTKSLPWAEKYSHSLSGLWFPREILQGAPAYLGFLEGQESPYQVRNELP